MKYHTDSLTNWCCKTFSLFLNIAVGIDGASLGTLYPTTLSPNIHEGLHRIIVENARAMQLHRPPPPISTTVPWDLWNKVELSCWFNRDAMNRAGTAEIGKHWRLTISTTKYISYDVIDNTSKSSSYKKQQQQEQSSILQQQEAATSLANSIKTRPLTQLQHQQQQQQNHRKQHQR